MSTDAPDRDEPFIFATDEDWFKHRHWRDHPDGTVTREPIASSTSEPDHKTSEQ